MKSVESCIDSWTDLWVDLSEPVAAHLIYLNPNFHSHTYCIWFDIHLFLKCIKNHKSWVVAILSYWWLCWLWPASYVQIVCFAPSPPSLSITLVSHCCHWIYACTDATFEGSLSFSHSFILPSITSANKINLSYCWHLYGTQSLPSSVISILPSPSSHACSPLLWIYTYYMRSSLSSSM
jgi:hypothetical protein